MHSKKPRPPVGWSFPLSVILVSRKAATRPIVSPCSFCKIHRAHSPCRNDLFFWGLNTDSMSLSNGLIHCGKFLYNFNGKYKNSLWSFSLATSLTVIGKLFIPVFPEHGLVN